MMPGLSPSPTVGEPRTPGTPLSSHDRDEIAHALTEHLDVSWTEIGRRIRRYPTTIMREVTTNGGRNKCRPAAVDRRAGRCRKRPQMRVNGHPAAATG